jgi:hypothetical protein
MKLEDLKELCDHLGFFYQAENLGFVTNVDGTWELTELAMREIDFKSPVEEEEPELILEELVDRYRDLFPRGVKSGGYYVSGDKKSCQMKLKRFLKKYNFSEQEILSATSNYVERMAEQGYQYMQLAHFFIEKNGVSNLAAECEQLKIDDVEKEGNSQTL